MEKNFRKKLRPIINVVMSAVMLTSLMIIELFSYPLSTNDIDDKMSDMEIIFEGRSYGVIVFLAENEEETLVYMFNESMFLPRFSLRHIFLHDYYITWDFIVPGKFHHVRLNNQGSFIAFEAERLRLPSFQHTLVILIFLCFSGNYIYVFLQNRKPRT